MRDLKTFSVIIPVLCMFCSTSGIPVSINHVVRVNVEIPEFLRNIAGDSKTKLRDGTSRDNSNLGVEITLPDYGQLLRTVNKILTPVFTLDSAHPSRKQTPAKDPYIYTEMAPGTFKSEIVKYKGGMEGHLQNRLRNLLQIKEDIIAAELKKKQGAEAAKAAQEALVQKAKDEDAANRKKKKPNKGR